MQTYRKLERDTSSDVIIIGGGLTGLVTAYTFQKEGLKPVICEKGVIGGGKTGVLYGGADVCDVKAVHDGDFFTSTKAAEIYANRYSAVKTLARLCGECGCNISVRDSLLFSDRRRSRKSFNTVLHILKSAGIPSRTAGDTAENKAFPFDFECGILTPDGGCSFDAGELTLRICDLICINGAEVYENTRITETVCSSTGASAFTSEGKRIDASFAVDCTGSSKDTVPLKKIGYFTMKCSGTQDLLRPEYLLNFLDDYTCQLSANANEGSLYVRMRIHKGPIKGERYLEYKSESVCSMLDSLLFLRGRLRCDSASVYIAAEPSGGLPCIVKDGRKICLHNDTQSPVLNAFILAGDAVSLYKGQEHTCFRRFNV